MPTITSLRLRRGAFKRPHLLAHHEVPLALLPPVTFSRVHKLEQQHVPFRPLLYICRVTSSLASTRSKQAIH